MKNNYFFFVLFSLLAQNLLAQTDTTFWFAPPDISHMHDHSDEYIEIRLANADTVPVTVSISQPANPSSTINSQFQSINIPVGGSSSINLSSTKTRGSEYKNLLETPMGKHNTGLLIQSTGFITAYYEVGRATSLPVVNKLFPEDTVDKNGEIFTLKGSNALGTHFFTPFQNEYDAETKFSDAYSSFDIVATEDDTKISFYLTRQGRGDNWYDPDRWHDSVVTLNKGETYSVQATAPWAGSRMVGSQIKSNKPIAVTMKDDSPKVWWSTGADLIGDQLVPVNIAGNEYIVVRGFLGDNPELDPLANNKSQVFIVGTRAGTVTIYGPNGPETFNLSGAGASFSHFISNTNSSGIHAERIVSSVPIYVYYVSGYGSEMGGPVLPPIKCTGSSQVTFVRSNEDPFYLTIISRQDAIGDFTIEPATLSLTSADFSFSAGDNWYVAQKRMDNVPIGEAVTVRNTKNYFHLGIINGKTVAGTSRFGYFSDYGKNNSKLPKMAEICPGSPLAIDPQLLAIDPNQTFWYKAPDTSKIIHTGITYTAADTGKYFMSFTDKRLCKFTDSIIVQHFAMQPFDLGKNADTVCSHTAEPIVISGEWKKINWTKMPTGASIPDSAKSWTPAVSGLYAVEVEDEFTCIQKDSIDVTFVNFPAIDLGLNDDSATSCGVKRIVLSPLGNDPNYEYKWSIDEILIPDSVFTFTPDTSGIYKVVVNDKKYPECLDQDQAFITFSPDVKINFEGDSGVSCFGSDYQLCADPGHKYFWTFNDNPLPETKECHIPRVEGMYDLTVTDKYNCKISDSIYVKYFSDMNLGLNGRDTIACFPYNNYTIKVAGDSSYTYEWFPPVTDKGEYTPAFSGDTMEMFKVKAINADGCYAFDSIYVKYDFEIKIPNITGGDTTACEYANYTIRPGGGFARYIWGGAVPAGYQDSTYIPKESGQIWVTVLNSNGCSQTSDTMDVNFAENRFIELGSQEVHCSYDTSLVKLDAGPGFERYEWMEEPAFDQQVFEVPLPDSTADIIIKDITVKAWYEKYCIAKGTKPIKFRFKNRLDLGGDTTVCFGETVQMQVSPDYDYFYWAHQDHPDIPVSNSNSYTATIPGLYIVIVNDECGEETDTKIINVWDLPNIDIGPEDTTICLGKILDVKNLYDPENSDKFRYEWMEAGTGQVLPNVMNILPVQLDGTYVGTVIDTNNCKNRDTIVVRTNDAGDCFFIPDLITPNDKDTLNTYLHINGILNGVWDIQIYNRWGDKVYEKKGYNNDWKAEGVVDGVYYYYLVHPTRKRSFKGYVQVMR